jgi:hypothetical protein
MASQSGIVGLGVRIASAKQDMRAARQSIRFHIERHEWLTNRRCKEMREGTLVLASAVGTRLFLKGVSLADEPQTGGDWHPRWRLAYPVRFEPVTYVGDMTNRVLDKVSSVRTVCGAAVSGAFRQTARAVCLFGSASQRGASRTSASCPRCG